MNLKIKKLLRWILVLPTALVAGFLATFPLHWLVLLKFTQEPPLLGFIELPESSAFYVENLLYPFVIALVYIYVGYLVAPAHKFVTATVLAGLYVLTAIALIFWVLSNDYKLEVGLRSVGPALGLVLGLFIVRQKSKESSD